MGAETLPSAIFLFSLKLKHTSWLSGAPYAALALDCAYFAVAATFIGNLGEALLGLYARAAVRVALNDLISAIKAR